MGALEGVIKRAEKQIEEMYRTNRRLRNILVYPRFQLLLVAGFLLINFATLLIVAAGSFKTIAYLKGLGDQLHLPQGHGYYKFVELEAKQLLRNFYLACAVSVLIGGALALMLSHRLAGPLVRLIDYFKKIGQTGRVSDDFQIRSSDFLVELPLVVNTALKKIKK